MSIHESSNKAISHDFCKPVFGVSIRSDNTGLSDKVLSGIIIAIYE